MPPARAIPDRRHEPHRDIPPAKSKNMEKVVTLRERVLMALFSQLRASPLVAMKRDETLPQSSSQDHLANNRASILTGYPQRPWVRQQIIQRRPEPSEVSFS
jgi:hypothetical protein